MSLLDIGAFQESLWGFNGFFSKQNGGGFLTEHFPEAQKSIWDFNGMFTKSRHVPNVEFAGLMHPGLIGCLPSKEMLLEWNKREIYFPVYVKGGGLSVGDLHFSQGDGEITFCGAIEPKYDDYLIFEGISVDEYGEQHYLDVHVAYRQACLNAINYLTKFGYSKAQAYSILGCAPVQGHISGVDVPLSKDK